MPHEQPHDIGGPYRFANKKGNRTLGDGVGCAVFLAGAFAALGFATYLGLRDAARDGERIVDESYRELVLPPNAAEPKFRHFQP